MPVILSKSIFYHIPKTGGTWVTQLLHDGSEDYVENFKVEFDHPKNLSSEHAPISYIPKEKRGGKFSYAFIRNPLEWYRSMWAFREENEWPDPDRFILDAECKSGDFDIFIENVEKMFPGGYLTEVYQEYVGKNADLIDFIGRVESLRDDFKIAITLADEIDFNLDLINTKKRQNVTNKDIKKRAFMSDESEEIIRNMDSWIFKTFNYD